MAQRQESAAYDFKTFEAKTNQKARAEIVNIAERQRKKNLKKTSVSILLACTVFIAIFAANVFGYIQLTETTSKISKATSQLETLQNEYKSLEISYASMVDLRNVEQLAIYNFGMSKLDKNQVEYIALNEKDKVEHLESERGGILGFVDDILDLLNISH